jgi:hypothetical protein
MSAFAPVFLVMSVAGVLLGFHIAAMAPERSWRQAFAFGLCLVQMIFVGFWVGRLLL